MAFTVGAITTIISIIAGTGSVDDLYLDNSVVIEIATELTNKIISRLRAFNISIKNVSF